MHRPRPLRTGGIALALAGLAACAPDRASDLQPDPTAPVYHTAIFEKPTKTATGYWEQGLTYDWTLQKGVSPSNQEIGPGSTGTLNYTLTATRTEIGRTDRYGVRGQICVKNAGSVDSQGMTAEDHVQASTNGGASWTTIKVEAVDVSANPVVSPGETACFPYDVTFTPVPGAIYRNEGAVTWTNAGNGLPNDQSSTQMWETAPVAFTIPSTATTTEQDEAAALADLLTCPAGFNCTPTSGSWSLTGSQTIEYAVQVTNASAPCGSSSTVLNTAKLTENDTGTERPASSSANITTPACAAGAIGDFVWRDDNGNGIQDAGEPGIGGQTVTLKQGGAVIATTTTDAAGQYLFTGLVGGPGVCYSVEVGTPAGMFPSPSGAGSNTAVDSNGSPAGVCLPTSSSVDRTIDFGFVPARPAIAIVKLTNGTNNNSAPGLNVPAGSPVTWTYHVTNTGNVTLSNVNVTDNRLPASAINCGAGNNVIGTLAAGASASCTATGTAVVGQYTNIGTASGNHGSTVVTASDPDNYFGVRQHADETATGAGTRYPNTSNWFMYSAYGTSKIDLIGGQKYDAGDIYMSRSSTATTIRIVLHEGWSWASVEENLKIHPFDSAPNDYLQPGKFAYKWTVSGNTVTVTIPGTRAKFYGIHGDMLRELP